MSSIDATSSSSSPEVIIIEPAEYYQKLARPVHHISHRPSFIKKSNTPADIITLSDDEDECPKKIQPANNVASEANTRDGRVEQPRICMTPVQSHWDKRGDQIKNLEYTHRELEMEYDAEYIRPKDHTEAFFTYIQDEELFFICMPFAMKPVYQEITFPVNENVIRELYGRIPPRWVHCLPELRHREGFNQFARYFHFRGSGYRLSVLMRRAFNVVVRNPNAQRILEKIAHECVPEFVPNPNVDDDYCRIRKGRAKRDAAAEIDGSTPYGCRQPMRPRVLFRDDEERMEKLPVKRRRLDLEMLD